MSGKEWTVCIPVSQLVAMQNSAEEVEELRKQNKQLQGRIDGLHRTLYEIMEIVSDLRKSATVSA